MTSERDLLRTLQHRFPIKPPVEVGIGDDGAVLQPGQNSRLIVVTDMLLDKVHFDLQQTPPRQAGRKALAVNLSDLAAMACWPTAAFISLAVPKSLTNADQFLAELYDGLAELADIWNFSIAGGDTNAWHGDFAINVCLTGVPMGKTPILRSGAEPGDSLVVTGPLGGSLKSGRHLNFEPQLDLANWLVTHSEVHAMMDISDGLSIDLHRMMEASGTGCLVELDQIPIHKDVPSELSRTERTQQALQDGEDFELLLAMSPENVAAPLFQQRLRQEGGRVVGTVTQANELCLQRTADGRVEPLKCQGWQHL